MRTLSLKSAFCFTALATLVTVDPPKLFPQGLNSTTETRQLPAFATLLEVYQKPISSPEFLRLVQQCGLKLYFRSEDLLLVHPQKNPRPPVRYPLTTTIKYGGSGLVVIARSRAYAEQDLNGPFERVEPRVAYIRLIVGKCDEQEMFGDWKGEMPKIELPMTPESLRVKYPSPDSDSVDVTFGGGGAFELSRRRRINYYEPAFGNSFPYAFIFGADNLAMVEVWPETPRK